MDQNVKNATVYINFKIIEKWYGIAKLTSRLEMKKEESCTHFFKCINCKDNYQIDNNNCLFWKHRFNRDWYNKKSQEL